MEENGLQIRLLDLDGADVQTETSGGVEDQWQRLLAIFDQKGYITIFMAGLLHAVD